MSRSQYSCDCEHLELYRASVDRALHGKRGQAFVFWRWGCRAQGESIVHPTARDSDGGPLLVGVQT